MHCHRDRILNRKEMVRLHLTLPGFEPSGPCNPVSTRLNTRSKTDWIVQDQDKTSTEQPALIRWFHDDVMKWKNFLRYWPFAGNSPVTGEFPSQRPVTRSFDIFFDLRLNKRLNKQSRRQWFETPPTDTRRFHLWTPDLQTLNRKCFFFRKFLSLIPQ